MLVPENTMTPIAENGAKSKSKLVNFDSEMTELVSGLKLNMGRGTVENSVTDPELDDEKLLLEPPDDVALVQLANNDINLLAHDFDPLTASHINKIIPTQNIEKSVQNEVENVNKPLSEIVIDLNSIQPHDEYQPRCILDEPNGLKILLNFTKDHPRPDIVVLVVTTTNHNSSALSNYQFEASVSKVGHMIGRPAWVVQNWQRNRIDIRPTQSFHRVMFKISRLNREFCVYSHSSLCNFSMSIRSHVKSICKKLLDTSWPH